MAGLSSPGVPRMPWHPQINPISTKGGRLCSPNNTCTPGFSDLPTTLHGKPSLDIQKNLVKLSYFQRYSTSKLAKVTNHSKECTQLAVYIFRKMAKNNGIIILISLPYINNSLSPLIASKLSIGCLKKFLMFYL